MGLTIVDIDISPLTKPRDSKLFNGFIKARLKETNWILYTQFTVGPKDNPAYVTDKIMVAMMQLINYINYPYDAPCENPYTGTNEVNSWHEELKRCGIEPEVKRVAQATEGPLEITNGN